MLEGYKSEICHTPNTSSSTRRRGLMLSMNFIMNFAPVFKLLFYFEQSSIKMRLNDIYWVKKRNHYSNWYIVWRKIVQKSYEISCCILCGALYPLEGSISFCIFRINFSGFNFWKTLLVENSHKHSHPTVKRTSIYLKTFELKCQICPFV